jgi:hypothetical protein
LVSSSQAAAAVHCFYATNTFAILPLLHVPLQTLPLDHWCFIEFHQSFVQLPLFFETLIRVVHSESKAKCSNLKSFEVIMQRFLQLSLAVDDHSYIVEVGSNALALPGCEIKTGSPVS